MEPRTILYGGREFERDAISYVRRLALGDKIYIAATRWNASGRNALETLKFKGLCTAQTDGGTGKYETMIYRATDELFALRDVQRANTPTFEALAQKMGKDISLPACRVANRKYRRRPAPLNDHKYPSIRDVSHRALIEAQGPLFTHNVPSEPGDETQFSSRGLTDWYVEQFAQLNHLKR